MSAPQKGDVTDCFRCGGSGKAYPDGGCGHCAGTGKLTWVDYGHSAPSEAVFITGCKGDPYMSSYEVFEEEAVKAKLCSEDEGRLDRLEALLNKIAEKLEIQP